MSLLMLIFLINSSGILGAKSPDDSDSLEVRPLAVTTSEEPEEEEVFQYN